MKFGQSESKYVAKTDLQRDDKSYTEALLTIESVTEEEVGDDKEPKFILYFRGRTKGMVLNASNMETMIETYGEPAQLSGAGATAHFAGKPILLWVDTTVKYAGKRVGGLRLRAPNVQAPVQTQQPAQPEEEPPPPGDGDYLPDTAALDDADLPF